MSVFYTIHNFTLVAEGCPHHSMVAMCMHGLRPLADALVPWTAAAAAENRDVS